MTEIGWINLVVMICFYLETIHMCQVVTNGQDMRKLKCELWKEFDEPFFLNRGFSHWWMISLINYGVIVSTKFLLFILMVLHSWVVIECAVYGFETFFTNHMSCLLLFHVTAHSVLRRLKLGRIYSYGCIIMLTKSNKIFKINP